MKYYDLTTPQNNIWNLQKFYENTAISNVCGAIIFNSEHSVGMLKKAIGRVICKQEGLRLQFCEIGGEPKQFVKEYEEYNVYYKEYDSQEAFERYASKLASTPMEMTNSPMYYFEVFAVENKVGILVLLNHLISDAWTLSLLAKEVENEYIILESDRDNIELVCDEVISYTDYVIVEKEYQGSVKYVKDELYWQEEYSHSPQNSPAKTILNHISDIRAKRLVKGISGD